MERVFNFAPGPSMLPLPVLEQIQKELLCYGSTGMSVMEMSHRSKMYLDIFNQTVADLREVMAIPENYKVIFPQGGATAMFAAVAMNLTDGGKALGDRLTDIEHPVVPRAALDRALIVKIEASTSGCADNIFDLHYKFPPVLSSRAADKATLADRVNIVDDHLEALSLIHL